MSFVALEVVTDRGHGFLPGCSTKEDPVLKTLTRASGKLTWTMASGVGLGFDP